MKAGRLMIMGTHSNVGKSILVTALCNIFAREGLRVAPFKSVNIALNAGLTQDGHEISRATIVQAEAAGILPHVDMNPVLVKPQSNGVSQLILNGHVYPQQTTNWLSIKAILWENVTAALDRLLTNNDLVIIEGAGSPVEINLVENDIVNMPIAHYAKAPVVLVGDIDLGGVFAALIGTLTLLGQDNRELIQGLIINKMRGDTSLLGDSLQVFQEKAFEKPVLGVVPFLPNIGVAAEDSVILQAAMLQSSKKELTEGVVDIAVIKLPSISNFDDIDPVIAESDVQIRFVENVEGLGWPSAIILPGSKSTIDDLIWLYERKLVEKIVLLATQFNVPTIGICGGYQMLGEMISDPYGVESHARVYDGLGLLPVKTVFSQNKQTLLADAVLEATVGPLATLHGLPIRGYEIHMGKTEATRANVPFLCSITNSNSYRTDGTLSNDGRIWGTYLHGIFDNDEFRHTWLRSIGWQGAGQNFDRQPAYLRLADHVADHLDMIALKEIISRGKNG